MSALSGIAAPPCLPLHLLATQVQSNEQNAQFYLAIMSEIDYSGQTHTCAVTWDIPVEPQNGPFNLTSNVQCSRAVFHVLLALRVDVDGQVGARGAGGSCGPTAHRRAGLQ